MTSDLAGRYTRSIFQSLRYRATWLPSETIRLGSYGFLRNGVFDERGQLKDLKVSVISSQRSAKASFVYQSSDGVKITFKTKGQLSDLFQSIAAGSGGALVEFSREGAVVFSAPSCTVKRISNIRAVEAQLAGVDSWQRDLVVVTRVVQADSATILVSNSGKSRVELKARATTGAGSGLVNLGVGYSSASSTDMAVEIVAQGGLTPLYVVENYRRTLTDTLARRQRRLQPTNRSKVATERTGMSGKGSSGSPSAGPSSANRPSRPKQTKTN